MAHANTKSNWSKFLFNLLVNETGKILIQVQKNLKREIDRVGLS